MFAKVLCWFIAVRIQGMGNRVEILYTLKLYQINITNQILLYLIYYTAPSMHPLTPTALVNSPFSYLRWNISRVKHSSLFANNDRAHKYTENNFRVATPA